MEPVNNDQSGGDNAAQPTNTAFDPSSMVLVLPPSLCDKFADMQTQSGKNPVEFLNYLMSLAKQTDQSSAEPSSSSEQALTSGLLYSNDAGIPFAIQQYLQIEQVQGSTQDSDALIDESTYVNVADDIENTHPTYSNTEFNNASIVQDNYIICDAVSEPSVGHSQISISCPNEEHEAVATETYDHEVVVNSSDVHVDLDNCLASPSPNQIDECDTKPLLSGIDTTPIISTNSNSDSVNLTVDADSHNLPKRSTRKRKLKPWLLPKCEKSQAENIKRTRGRSRRKYRHHCHECEYMASSKSDLMDHCLVEHNTEFIKTETAKINNHHCCECDFEASTKAELIQHGRTVHNVEVESALDVKKMHKPSCNDAHAADCSCKDSDNVTITPSGKYKCEVCFFSSNFPQLFRNHVKLNHTTYACVYCTFKADSQEDIRKHNESEHDEENDELILRIDKDASVTDKLRCWYRCEQCDYITIYVASIEKHYSYVHKTDITPEQINPESEKLPSRRGRQRVWYDCELCYNFSTDLKAGLISHWKHIHKKYFKTYVCELCGQSYHCHSSFRNHQQHKHSSIKYTCEYVGCDRSYQTKSNLQKHVSIVHEGIRKYVCKTEGCEKTFTNTTQLQEHHVRIHLQERPHQCPWEGCEKSFYTSRHLVVHTRIHMNLTPIQCQLCNFECRQRNSLNLHMRNYHSATRLPPNRR